MAAIGECPPVPGHFPSPAGLAGRQGKELSKDRYGLGAGRTDPQAGRQAGSFAAGSRIDTFKAPGPAPPGGGGKGPGPSNGRAREPGPEASMAGAFGLEEGPAAGGEDGFAAGRRREVGSGGGPA